MTWRNEAVNNVWADAYSSNRQEVLTKITLLTEERIKQRSLVEKSQARIKEEAPRWFSKCELSKIGTPF